MYKNKKILGLIPARGGSKRLPGKNIKLLSGKPLIAWTIEQALSSKYLDKIIVSTEDEEIAKVSRKHGAEIPFMRPLELAADTAKAIDAITHAIEYFEKKGVIFDFLALLEPTSPLRASDDIDNAIKLLIDNADSADSLISIGKVTLEHPFMAQSINEEGFIIPFVENKASFARLQDIPKEAYIPYGVIYLSKVDRLKELRTFYQLKTLPYFIQRWQNYEVDDKYDFMAIERILQETLDHPGLHLYKGI
jgi:CMP-N,N'-diacetyllegionaminic acid synthase